MPPSQTTLDRYKSNIKILTDRVGGKLDISKIYDYIEGCDKSLNTKTNYLNSMLTLDMPEALKEKYQKLREENFGKLRQKVNDNDILTDNQKKVLDTLTIEKVHGFIKDLEKDVTYSLSKDEWRNFLILKILDNAQLRNDLGELVVIKSAKDDDGERNFVVMNKSTPCTIILNDHKTAKSAGTITVKLPADTCKYLRKYMKKFEIPYDSYLFVNSEGNGLTTTGITKILNSMFHKKFGAKVGQVGTSALRKLYNSEKYGKVVDEMQEDAKVQGHSVQTGIKLYTKKPDKPKSDDGGKKDTKILPKKRIEM